jgi:hypothetical protein
MTQPTSRRPKENPELRVEEVFGVTPDLPKTYFSRRNVDTEFIGAFQSGKYIVIFGGSKQGKTSLRKSQLSEDRYIVVHCQNNWSIEDLHREILKQANYMMADAKTEKSAASEKVNAGLRGRVLGIDSEIGSSKDNTSGTESVFKSFGFDLNSPNDVVKALKSMNFQKYVVIEDFHYLPIPTQQRFSICLKTFYELSSEIKFMIVGIWMQEDKLLMYNGDLTGRIREISVNVWTKGDLRNVIAIGEKLLNFNLNDDAKEFLIDNCHESVYVVQEVCLELCRKYDVRQPKGIKIHIGTVPEIRELLFDLVKRSNNRFRNFIDSFRKFKEYAPTEDIFEEYFSAILNCILYYDLDKLKEGIGKIAIERAFLKLFPRIQYKHEKLDAALKDLIFIQISCGVNPLILDYDTNDCKVKILDYGFLLWLSHQDRSKIIAEKNLRPKYSKVQQATNVQQSIQLSNTTPKKSRRSRRRSKRHLVK